MTSFTRGWFSAIHFTSSANYYLPFTASGRIFIPQFLCQETQFTLSCSDASFVFNDTLSFCFQGDAVQVQEDRLPLARSVPRAAGTRK